MARKGIFFPLKDAALRDDVHTLGALVGEVLKDQGGPPLYDAVEGDRQAAIGRRLGEAEDTVELVVRTRGRPPAEAREVIRAFAAWFQVVNMAEKVHRVRRRRQYMHDSSTPQPGGMPDCFQKLKARGLGLAQVLELLGQVGIEPVFTPHPTESTRRTILRQQQRIARLLLRRLDPSLTPPEQGSIVEHLRSELTTAWQTAENSRERLTVADEREHVLFFLAEVVYEVIPDFYAEVEAALVGVYGAEAQGVDVPDVLRFGSWVGGDMDGHPDVHAKTIRESCARHHQLIINRYFLEAQELGEKLSQSASRVGVTPQVLQRIEQYRTLVPGARATAPANHDRMPYRVLVGQIAERLRATYDHASGQYERASQLVEDLELIARSLIEHRGRHAGLFYVQRLLRRVRAFGFHLATLDVRQNARVHRQIVGQGLGEEGWCEMSAAERTRRLTEALAADESPVHALDPAGKRALWVFEAMEYCDHRYGSLAIGTYVVSMAADVDDLLTVLLMARWAGYTDAQGGQAQLDVAPLFDSVESLEHAGDTITRLLQNRVYREHLASRGNRQVVMIGYSNSNKDSGIVASRWLLRRAQEAMSVACVAAGVRLQIFHGRGGSISRGGSRTEAIVRALPAGVAGTRLRVVEQGESINDRYGLAPIALRTFEQGLSTLSLMAAGYYGTERLESRWLEAMDLFARVSQERYRAVVVDDPRFMEFFLHATPVDVIERMQIGSRPVAYVGGAGVAGMRAVPWLFAWSQSRHMLPGWFGAGAGLAAVQAKFGAPFLSEMYGRWPFFEGLLDDVEMRMARADLGIAAQYEELVPPMLQRLAGVVREEFGRATEQVLAIKGCARLLDSEPTLQRSIRLRNPYVDPIHLTQVDLLRRWREAGRDDRELFDALLASVNGIAQGLQGTG